MINRPTNLFRGLLASGMILALATPALAGVEPTPTATATATAEPTPTATATATAEPTPTATATATATAEPTPTATATAEPTPTATATAEPTPTATATAEPTPTATATATAEPTPTATATAEPTPTATATAEPTPTATATATAEPTPTATATATAEPTPTATATAEPTPTATATATAEPTPTATATAEPTPTATPTPGASNCLCEVVDITPGQISLRNVGTPGAKGSKLTKNVTMIAVAVDAPGARCKPNEFSDPTPISLRMVDDTGDVLVDRSKTVVCSGRPNETTNVKIPVKFEGPQNCKDGAVPTGNKPSTGNITSTATGSPGTAVYEEITRIKCKD